MKIILENEDDTAELAKKIAKNAEIGDVITLVGDLGSGKTTFSKYFINSLCKKNSYKEIEVTSPTFNIVKIYDLNNLSVYHFDLYRIKNTEELYEIGLDDALENGISLIEWPEIANDILPKNYCNITFYHGKDNNERIVNVEFLDYNKKFDL